MDRDQQQHHHHHQTTPMPDNNMAIPDVTKTINKRMRRKHNKWTLIITFASLVLIIILITIAYLVAKGLLNSKQEDGNASPTLIDKCLEQQVCSIELVETIPPVLVYPDGSPRHSETADVWKKLIGMANSTIHIISFYWTLRGDDIPGPSFPQAKTGEEIMAELFVAANRGIKIQIAQQMPTAQFPNKDTEILAKHDNIEVRSVNMASLLGAGIVHTKVWIIDEMHLYVGSANFDWRSLTEVKEMGTAMYNCPCAGQDINKIFAINWAMGLSGASIPDHWPSEYHTNINKDHRQTVPLETGSSLSFYLSTSPPQFCAPDRTSDIDSIVDTMEKAEKFVYIAVMDYMAAVVYDGPRRFYSVIDDEIRKIVYGRGINVRMLFSNWSNTDPQQVYFLKSLKEFGKMPKIKGSLSVRLFTVPPNSTIPYARVNHNKYMVTDNAAFISTSNWSGDYFISTGGVSLTVQQPSDRPHNYTTPSTVTMPIRTNVDDTIRKQLEKVFERDWNSQYSTEL